MKLDLSYLSREIQQNTDRFIKINSPTFYYDAKNNKIIMAISHEDEIKINSNQIKRLNYRISTSPDQLAKIMEENNTCDWLSEREANLNNYNTDCVEEVSLNRHLN